MAIGRSKRNKTKKSKSCCENKQRDNSNSNTVENDALIKDAEPTATVPVRSDVANSSGDVAVVPPSSDAISVNNLRNSESGADNLMSDDHLMLQSTQPGRAVAADVATSMNSGRDVDVRIDDHGDHRSSSDLMTSPTTTAL